MMTDKDEAIRKVAHYYAAVVGASLASEENKRKAYEFAHGVFKIVEEVRSENVRRGNMMRAGPLKIAEYVVRNPETGEWGPTQLHMTYDNTVMAVLGPEAAKLLVNFMKGFPDVEQKDAPPTA